MRARLDAPGWRHSLHRASGQSQPRQRRSPRAKPARTSPRPRLRHSCQRLRRSRWLGPLRLPHNSRCRTPAQQRVERLFHKQCAVTCFAQSTCLSHTRQR